jgi:hypothetical protein
MAKSIVHGNETERLDVLTQKLAQLEAVLAMSYGDAGESFRNMNDDLQDNYLWSCGTLARECKELALSLASTGDDCALGGTAHLEVSNG